MSNFIYKIGFLGPLLLFCITVYLLWNQMLVYVYVIGLVLNSILNKILKMVVQQKRPHGKSIMNETYSGIETYGMPSGHAQSVFYSITFLYLYGYKSILFLGITCLTVYQRWKYNNHTLQQLLIGSFVGIGMAYFIYKQTHILPLYF